ncbi:MAG: hypothetical protein HON94_01005 [Methylococcales bacterium]|nr:hypothetical protein [Methylococcales bacterium]
MIFNRYKWRREMGLSCQCDFDDYVDDSSLIFWYRPDEYTVLNTSKRKRCCSCGELIDIGSTVIAFKRYRNPSSEVEENIHGEYGEIPLANKYQCEQCADIYFSLIELGFCFPYDDNVHDLLAEYRRITS